MSVKIQSIQYPPDQIRKERSEDVKIQLEDFFNNHSDQLRKEISEDVKIQLEEFLKHYKPVPPPVYVTRQWVSEKFDVDLSTVHNWSRKGILKPVGLGSRVYFLLSDIEASLIPLHP